MFLKGTKKHVQSLLLNTLQGSEKLDIEKNCSILVYRSNVVNCGNMVQGPSMRGVGNGLCREEGQAQLGLLGAGQLPQFCQGTTRHRKTEPAFGLAGWREEVASGRKTITLDVAPKEGSYFQSSLPPSLPSFPLPSSFPFPLWLREKRYPLPPPVADKLCSPFHMDATYLCTEGIKRARMQREEESVFL